MVQTFKRYAHEDHLEDLFTKASHSDHCGLAGVCSECPSVMQISGCLMDSLTFPSIQIELTMTNSHGDVFILVVVVCALHPTGPEAF